MSAIVLEETEEGLSVRGERGDKHVTLYVVYVPAHYKRSYSYYGGSKRYWVNDRYVVSRDPEGKREITHHSRVDIAQTAAIRRIRRWVK